MYYVSFLLFFTNLKIECSSKIAKKKIIDDFVSYYYYLVKVNSKECTNEIEIRLFLDALNNRYTCIKAYQTQQIYHDNIYNIFFIVKKYIKYEDYKNEKFKMTHRHTNAGNVYDVQKRNICLKSYVIIMHEANYLPIKFDATAQYNTYNAINYLAESVCTAINFFHKHYYACGFFSLENIFVKDKQKIVLAFLSNITKLEHAPFVYMQRTTDTKNKDYFYICAIIYCIVHRDKETYNFIFRNDLFDFQIQNAKILANKTKKNDLGIFIVNFVAGNIKYKIRRNEVLKMISKTIKNEII